MREILLTQGKVAIVDDEDYDRLMGHSWHYRHSHRQGYGYAVSKERVPMQVMIMSPFPGLIVDHIDGNTLDNRKRNLRVCTKGENRLNSRIQTNNTSGYKGVYWMKSHGCWHARITVHKKRFFLGAFQEKEHAARAYNEAAKIHFGEFARLNDVPDGPIVRTAKRKPYRPQRRKAEPA